MHIIFSAKFGLFFRYFSQMKNCGLSKRSIDEGGMDEQTGMNFAKYVAILSGDTSILEKSKLEKKVAVLEISKTAHFRQVAKYRFSQSRKMEENRKSKECKSDKIPFLMPLRNFLEGIKDDQRIRTTHSAVFLTLYDLWLDNDGKNPIKICKREVMKKAKIISPMTWHRTIIELNEYGYVDYQPTFNRTSISTVSL